MSEGDAASRDAGSEMARPRRNAVAVFAARVVAALATTAVVAISAHRLDQTEFGLVVSTMAAGFLLNTLITFGTDTLITRSIAAGDSDAGSVTRGALALQLGAASLATVAAAIAVLVGAPSVLLVEALSLLPLAIVTVASAVVRGVERMEHLLRASVTVAVVSLGLTIVGFMVWDEPLVPIAARAIAACGAAVVLGRVAQSYEAWHGAVRVASLLRRAAPFAAMVVLAAIGTQAGLLIVEFLADEPTGGYGAAVRLFEAGRMVPASVIAAFFPAMVRGIHRRVEYRRSMLWLVGYSLATTIALIALAGPIDRWVFARQPDGPTLIRILALALPVTVLRLVLSFEAIAEGRERGVAVSAAVGCAMLITGGIAVAGRLGAAGVAWAQLAGVTAAVIVLAVDRRSGAASSAPA
ncbi:MAG: oligosaccharide flippase family protein [Actinomycetota bacterium]